MTEILTSASFPNGAQCDRSEFEARGLTALKAAANAANEAYYAHHYSGEPDDIDAQIAFDIEEAGLMRACSDTRRAYEAALSAFVSKRVTA